MEAKELRLNNFVIANHKTDLLSIVTWIQEDSVNVEFERQPDLTNGLVLIPKNLIPIPLTQELLEKIGFRFTYHGDYAECGILCMLSGFFAIINDGNGFHYTGYCASTYVEINYLHQLQNLYYAVVGEELKCDGILSFSPEMLLKA